MHHHRLFSELTHRLARRALAVIAPLIRDEERRDAFAEFCACFRDELLWYETQRERMWKRLGRSEPEQPRDDGDEP